MVSSVWLLLAGEFVSPFRLPRAGEPVAAVDGGLRHAQALGVVPDCWVGDFDSGDALVADVPRLVFPVDKDESDFELALALVRERWPQARCLWVVGADGDEPDHVFGNVWVLPRFGFSALLFGRKASCFFARGPAVWRLTGQAGARVSVFALSALQGVCYQGLRWGAEGLALPPFVARGARNVLLGGEAFVRWQAGDALVFLDVGVVVEPL